MNEQEILNKLEEQGRKIDEIYQSVEKTRKYFLTIVIVSIVALVLPLVGIMFAIPSFLESYQELSNLGI